MDTFLSHLQSALQPDIDRVLHHPFFERLNSAALSRQQVQKFALDYNFYCRSFPQLLGYAAAKIADDQIRMPIVENLWEEHGEGDITRSHRQLYTNFLRSLKLSDEQIETSVPSTATARYIQELFDICSTGDFLDVLALVGPGTEYFASREFEIILSGLEKYPFAQDLDLEYWSIHIEVDDHHSSDTLKAILPFMNTDSNKQQVLDVSRKTVELEIYFWDEMNRYVA
jgi:pyrroloquinoline-quinone synthase